MAEKMRLLIFGAGAIGTYVGGSMLLDGHEVAYLEKPEVCETLRKSGIHLTLNGSSHHITTGKFFSNLTDIFRNDTFDAALVAVKSFDTPGLISTISPFKIHLPPIVCFQNGVENEQLFSKAFGIEKVIAGTITSAVRRVEAGNAVLERKRGVGLAGDIPLVPKMVTAFSHAGLNAQQFRNAPDMKWSKLLTNLITNASSAVLNMTPAEVLSNPVAFHYELVQMREALKVMHKLGCQVVDLPGTPVRLFAGSVSQVPQWIAQPLLKDILGKGRGAKMPSLHIDLHAGRRQSEVSSLNGAVVKYGKQAGIDTPVNQLLAATLEGMASGTIPIDAFEHNPLALYSSLR
jgi:2-dehydropantoate 2-reductase